MNYFLSLFAFYILLQAPLFVFSQNTTEKDSLFRVIARSKKDTNTVNSFNSLARLYAYSDADSSLFFGTQAKEIAEKIGFTKGIGNAYHRIGHTHFINENYEQTQHNWSRAYLIKKELNDMKGASTTKSNLALVYAAQDHHDMALSHYYEALEMDRTIGNLEGVSRILGNIGNTFQEMGIYQKALEAQFEALTVREQMEDQSDLAYSYTSIGNLYLNLNDYDKALEYHLKALEFAKNHSDKRLFPIALGNVGVAYFEKNDLAKAMHYYEASYSENMHMNRKDGAALMLTNMGVALATEGQLDKAMEQQHKALIIYKELQNRRGMTTVLSNIGSIHLEKKNYIAAEKVLKEALQYAMEIEAIALQEKQYYKLYETYFGKRDYQRALEAFTLHSILKDSLNLENNSKNLAQLELRHVYESRISRDSIARVYTDELKQLELDKQHIEIEKQRTQLHTLIFILIVVLALIAIIFNRFKVTQKQNTIIQTQKQLVEEKNQEISDSIRYAQRIQQALLPAKKELSDAFPSHFLIYQPKDVVAGDFYWLYHDKEKTYLAVADCTGHGVPGAMVSLVCINALHRSIHEFKKTNVAELLDCTRAIIVSEFEKSPDKVNDGMDISIICIEKQPERGTFLISFSGANNPLWMIRKGTEHVEEVKGDKQPIGKFDQSTPFSNHELLLHKEDMLYLMTDGFQDQFGGVNNTIGGKKFKPKQLKESLISLSNRPIHEQGVALTTILTNWQGEREQVDDICMIGIQL